VRGVGSSNLPVPTNNIDVRFQLDGHPSAPQNEYFKEN
jgi:hypothetical protein